MTAPLRIRFGSGPADIVVDVDRLLESRLLIQGTSGSGKTTLGRAIAEQLHGKVQQFILDREGELVTLRDRFDYIVVGKDGDISAELKTAKPLARAFLELNVSVIFDLSELRLDDQRAYVRIFFEELLHVPRSLWRPLLVMLDEAHLFAPESGQSSSTEAVAGMASLGRKRGFALVAMTQRLSKLKKDVASELNNKLIGFTDDVDAKRAADQLGMPADERTELMHLDPGTFMARGPAISRHRVLIQTDKPTTQSPPRGSARAAAPPPRAAVSKALAQLKDLAHKAEEEVRTIEDLTRQVAERDRKIRQLEKSGTVVEKPVVDQAAIAVAVANAVEKARAQWTRDLRRVVEKDMRALAGSVDKVKAFAGRFDGVLTDVVTSFLALDGTLSPKGEMSVAIEVPHAAVLRPPVRVEPVPAQRVGRSNGQAQLNGDLSGPQQRILNTLAAFEALGIDQPSKANVAVFSGASPRSSAFANNLGRLRNQCSYIEYPMDGAVALTEAGREHARTDFDISSVEKLHNAWFAKLPGPQVRILEVLIDEYPDDVDREQLADAAEASPTSSAYANNLGALRSLGLIDYRPGKRVVATDLLFPEGLGR